MNIACLVSRQRHGLTPGRGEYDSAIGEVAYAFPIGAGQHRYRLATSQTIRLGFRQGQGRDVVQRGLDRKHGSRIGGTMPEGLQRLQGNRIGLAEGSDGAPAQGHHVSAGAQGTAQIAGQGPHIGAFAAFDFEYGQIRAEETRPYIGVFDFYVQDLTFVGPLPGPESTPVPEPTPIPTPTASLPIAGDPAVTKIPKIALMAGVAAVVTGAGLLLAARRKVH